MHQIDYKTGFSNSRNCPVCSTSQAKLIREVESKSISFRIVKCCKCGFVYVANPRDDSVSAGQEPIAFPVEGKHRLIKKLLVRLSKGNRKLKVLEVGCGWGGLASLVCGDWRYDYTGFEPSAVRSAYCRKHGLNVVDGYFSASKDKLYDVAILDNVLEHVYDPAGLLRQVVSSIVKGGCVIVIVPNLHDIRRFIPAWRKRHYWQPFSHINYFKFRDLKRIFKSLGLEIDTFPVLLIRGRHSFLHFIQSILDKMHLRILGHYVIGRKS